MELDGKNWIGLALTTVFLFLMISIVDLQASIDALEQAEKSFLLLALFSANAPLLVFAFVWRDVLSMIDVELDYITTLRIVLANTFVNNVTPFGNIGGEAASTLILSKLTGKNYGTVFSAVFTSSLINFSPLATFLVIGGLYTGRYETLTAIAFIIVSSLSLIYILKNIKISFIQINFLNDFISDLREASNIIKSSNCRLILLAFFTHFAAFMDVLAVVLIGYALGLDLLAPAILLVVPLARFANYAPTPGGTGPYELALTGLLVYFLDLTVPEAVLVSVAYRALTYYTGLLIGYMALNSFQFREKVI